MKHITKENEPQAILEWKASDKMYLRGNAKWKRLKTPKKEILRANILAEQGYLCCYCERRIGTNDFHLEHLKPRTSFPEDIFDYTNMLCSCQLEMEKGEPRHCGNSKGSWFEDNNFVSPLSPDCEEQFRFTFDGQILGNDSIADTTIERLQLGISKLNDLRKEAIAPFLDEELTPEELNIFVQGYLLGKEENDGQFNEFYTTIQYLFL